MISFIIIGRNEGWKLPLCLKSVFLTIKENNLKNYEVIYIDSNSTDNSIENAKILSEIKIIQLTGEVNAAIARNVGAKESKGDVLFFIDGDMELFPEFLSFVYSEQDGLKCDFVSGNWVNINYDTNDKLLSEEIQFKIDRDIIEQTTGGLFLIKGNIWNSIGGMRIIFRKSQDIDLGLRLAKARVFLFRKKEIAAKHHTVADLDKNRMWVDLF
jgi:glycosyltransferase involved in cell wall biosynthesis